jgi:predicted transglutaminase-like cysteine proteinase
MIKFFRTGPFAFLALLFCVGAVAAGIAEFSPNLLRHIHETWGGEAVDRLKDWSDKESEWVAKAPNKSVAYAENDLKPINKFWNKIAYLSDNKHWGADDYWATPVEMLSSNAGDCEDYSIAKYFSLKEMGVPPSSLRITYVRALKTNESHMVLAYYPKPDAEPYILDNLTGKLLLASERMDLEPIYSFNDDDMWTAGVAASKGKSNQIRLWSDLLEKMEKERRM